MSNQNHENQLHKSRRGKGQARRRAYAPAAEGPANQRTARQMARYHDLRNQFFRSSRKLVGRTAFMVLPGHGCHHSTEQFRPVHWERKWRQRPFFVLLSASRVGNQQQLTLAGATSSYNESAGLLTYANGYGQLPCQYNFTREPRKGSNGEVLDGAENHVLFTAANNCLQELVNSADQRPQPLTLPRLVVLIEGRHIPIDEAKLNALAANVPEELREQYKQRRREDAEIVSLGTRFGDAAVMPDAAIKAAFKEHRVYEDYSELLGAEVANPARKIVMARNPARTVIAKNNLSSDWGKTADQELCERLLTDMRSYLPLPEMFTDSDLLDALEQPARPLHPSRTFVDLVESEPGVVVRAMRNSFPRGAAIREAVTDDELLAAARNPYNAMTVGKYSRVQVVNTEDFSCLPPYATGTFWAQPKTQQLEIVGDMPEPVEAQVAEETGAEVS